MDNTECVEKIGFIHMFAVKLGRELILLTLAAIPTTSNINWDLMTDSCILLFLEQLVYRAGCFESFN